MENINQIINNINAVGFDGAIAIATEAEVQAGAACGMLCIITAVIDEQK